MGVGYPRNLVLNLETYALKNYKKQELVRTITFSIITPSRLKLQFELLIGIRHQDHICYHLSIYTFTSHLWSYLRAKHHSTNMKPTIIFSIMATMLSLSAYAAPTAIPQSPAASPEFIKREPILPNLMTHDVSKDLQLSKREPGGQTWAPNRFPGKEKREPGGQSWTAGTRFPSKDKRDASGQGWIGNKFHTK